MGLNQLFVGLINFVSVCLVTKMSGTAYSSRPVRIGVMKIRKDKIDQLTAIYPKLQYK
jgi:hypothetical protein